MLQLEYDSPEEFRPERYIENPNLMDPRDVAFGFGRRSAFWSGRSCSKPLLMGTFNQDLSRETLRRCEHVGLDCQLDCTVRHTSRHGRKWKRYYSSGRVFAWTSQVSHDFTGEGYFD